MWYAADKFLKITQNFTYSQKLQPFKYKWKLIDQLLLLYKVNSSVAEVGWWATEGARFSDVISSI